jgi:hypothetical protein
MLSRYDVLDLMSRRKVGLDNATVLAAVLSTPSYLDRYIGMHRSYERNCFSA